MPAARIRRLRKGRVISMNRFLDCSISHEERIEWLLKEMTVEEKLAFIACHVPEIERLGIKAWQLGGEAAHGVQGRNDENGIGTPDITTSFPQPIGMSASFDPALIQKCGEVVGTEARVVEKRHPGLGLVRFAPTVDLCRDPRWGRNEEGYGEDPFLTGAMGTGYVKGLQGEHPGYIRCGATLKHFYGNNVEDGRGWKNSSISPRNKYELYLEPFRRCIENGHAEAVMTAYNKVNGEVGMFNPDVQKILKDQYGLTHAVSDGAALGLSITAHHAFGLHAEGVAAALKAGMDGILEDPRSVREAAAEAYELGLIDEADLDRAIACTMRTRLKLGVYDEPDRNPYSRVTEADILTEEAGEICRQMSRESVVLLKNEASALPLSRDIASDDFCVIGPLADVWYQDWYGGTPAYRTTLLDGIKEITGAEVDSADGIDRVMLMAGNQGVRSLEDGKLVLSDEPDVFRMEYWGEGSYTFQNERTKLFLTVKIGFLPAQDMGEIRNDAKDTFDWFVNEIFRLIPQEDGTVALENRFHYPVYLNDRGGFYSMKPDAEGVRFTVRRVEDGIEKAVALAKTKKTVLLALGCNPMINAKEEIDRTTLALPDRQQELMERILEVNTNVILVLFANYPYDIRTAKERVPAIILSATGSQDMGRAMAECIFGLAKPAGRLNQTWVSSLEELPPIDDYDIIKGNRTYRYYEGEPLYPFGHGLTYTSFAYAGLHVEYQPDATLSVSFSVENTGDTASDEVAQLYGSAPLSRAKKPKCQLIGFERLKNILPGERRQVKMIVPVDEFRFFDVVSGTLMVEEGIYTLFAGRSSADAAVRQSIFIPGQKTGVRDMARRVPMDCFDDYENMYITKGCLGYDALSVLCPDEKGVLIFKDCDIKEDYGVISLHFKSEHGCRIEVFVNDRPVGSYEGDSRTCEFRTFQKPDRLADKDLEIRNQYRQANFETVDFELSDVDRTQAPAEVRIEMTGDIRVAYMRCTARVKGPGLNIGVAN